MIQIPVDGKVIAKVEGVSLDAVLDIVGQPPFQRLGIDGRLNGTAIAIWNKGDVNTLSVESLLRISPSDHAVAGEVPATGLIDGAMAMRDTGLAEEYFLAASALDEGDDSTQEEAAVAYRKALELDPYLVAALINLANIHYSRDELAEAQALYERAIGLESDFFEAHFNLGNIYHDLGRFPEAQACYREALRLNPYYAVAHFYLAVTFEKMGLSQEARPHWRSYRQLAPKGEWVELAKEFSE